MTEIKAKARLKNLRIAPRKVRKTIGPIRGLSTDEALAELSITNVRSARPLVKLIKSAVANARDKNISPEKLFIASIRVDEGPALKRALPRAKGRATLVQKRWSHVTIELGEKEKAERKFVIPEKVKEIKKTIRAEKSKPKVRPEAGAKERPTKPGFMKKIFSRRKTI